MAKIIGGYESSSASKGSELREVNAIKCDGYIGLATISPGHVSTVNSTSTILTAGDDFPGEWEDITNFGVISVTVNSSHASATNGLCVCFSSDSF